MIDGTNRDIENVQDNAPPDGAVGGTGGVVNNQDGTAQ